MPKIKAVCPECAAVLALGESVTPGKNIRCPKCQTVFAVPDDVAETGPVRSARGPDRPRRFKAKKQGSQSGVLMVSSNPPGAAAPNMVQLKRLEVKLNPFPLLHGAIEVQEFKLVEPAIALEVDKQGRPNWAFSPPAPAGARPGAAAPGAPPAQQPAAGGTNIPAISLGDISIVDGQASYLDQRSGENRDTGPEKD